MEYLCNFEITTNKSSFSVKRTCNTGSSKQTKQKHNAHEQPNHVNKLETTKINIIN